MEQNEFTETSVDFSGDVPELAMGEIEVQACQSCRRRKLKCDRAVPTCSQCLRINCDCVYDRKKQKPGIKGGAIEGLNRRLELLEKILLDGNGSPKSFVEEKDFHHHMSNVDLEPTSRYQSEARINLDQPQEQTRKRKRLDLLQQDWDNAGEEALSDFLPSTPRMVIIVQTFCQLLHPWIPFLHLAQLQEFINDPQNHSLSYVVLHAIVFSTIHHCKNVGTSEEQSIQARRSKNVVMLTATNWLALENIQALIIVAFHHMGCGNFSKAWPIIGSLTRTVQYLQLTVESDHGEHHCLSEPLNLLERPQTWTESENRRRILWNVFLLDRFCSVTTGWNTSLTSDDVHCKLPCDGGHWHREEPVTTPFFGIWDKTAAKIGNSVAYMPSYYPSPGNEDSSPRGSSIDVSKLGAFAYCIEATESLSQVTTFFLQQKVDFLDRAQVNGWLTRFKELDLRLVHWKMFLPQKWKDSNISRDGGTIDMDPNLTLAHITHNTSMILLHQHIAYPPSAWSDLVKLPSTCSVETCRLAAVETASITQKYLKYTGGILNHQFSFCAFVAARFLLAYARASDIEIPIEYFALLESLNNISRRWRGNQGLEEDVPHFNAQQLQFLRQDDSTSRQESIDAILNCSPCPVPTTRVTLGSTPSTSNPISTNRQKMKSPHTCSGDKCLHQKQSQVVDPLEPHLVIEPELISTPQFPEKVYVQDELAEMSDILLGQQFLQMDRVITLDGTDFALDFETWE